MTTKLLAACTTLMLIGVFFLPASASATNDPQMTSAGGLVSTGTKILATSIGEATITTTAGAGLVHCTNAAMTAELKNNSGGTVEAEITAFSLSGTAAISTDNSLNECTGSFGNAYYTVTMPLCIKSTPLMITDEFQISGGTCAAPAKVRFTFGSTTAGACTFESTGNVQGDYTTGGSQAQLTFRNTSAGSGITKTSGGILCISSGALKMSFGLETESGAPLTIS